MILEDGDYFIISDLPQVFSNPSGMTIKIPSEFDGMVFRAALVEGDYVVAEVIERDRPVDSKPMTLSINYTRHEISPVSEDYARLISDSRSFVGMLTSMPDSEGPDGPLDLGDLGFLQ